MHETASAPEPLKCLTSFRRLSFLPAALLTATALAASYAEPVEADDPKPAASGSTTAPSGAPGGAPDKGGLLLADAIKQIPVAAEVSRRLRIAAFRPPRALRASRGEQLFGAHTPDDVECSPRERR
ncbi:hypothetical protein ACFC3O_12760 [Streptomyces sp. NPDC056007]|uniref:hypothetical protein n=1 Tax=Streptomyces sp. NPDC056007 TaxID=3345678 RepID=UPI0017B816D9|nr:hypothetical protein [Streptomyces sp. SJ1-7]